MVVANDSSTQNSPTSTPAPQPTAEDLQFNDAVQGAIWLRAHMREPDSFRLTQAIIVDTKSTSGNVCYEYLAKNVLGGMAVGHAVYIQGGMIPITDDTPGFHGLWKDVCGNRSGEDKTDEVAAVLKFK
jgi:hypothetical protein